MQSDVDSSAFEVVSTADWLQLLTRHAPGQEDQLRCVDITPLDCHVQTAWHMQARQYA